MKIHKFHSIYILLLFSVLSCGSNQGASAGKNQTTQKAKPTLPLITIDGIQLSVEIVQDPETRELGLMHRDDLPENQGMLFVFNLPQILSFWMRNTFISLDIAFISETGEIVDIQRMEPLDENVSYVSAKRALYALEVNAGWFEKNKILVGSTVKF